VSFDFAGDIAQGDIDHGDVQEGEELNGRIGFSGVREIVTK